LTTEMTGGSIVFNPNTQRYEVQSYECVQWTNEIAVEPKVNEPITIEYLFEQDDQNPNYTEFKVLDQFNPVIYWSRPPSPCLKVYMAGVDGEWVYEPIVFASGGFDPVRMIGVLETDDSNAGDSATLIAGVERPQPDISELIDAPEVGSLTNACPGQGGALAAPLLAKALQ